MSEVSDARCPGDTKFILDKFNPAEISVTIVWIRMLPNDSIETATNAARPITTVGFGMALIQKNRAQSRWQLAQAGQVELLGLFTRSVTGDRNG